MDVECREYGECGCACGQLVEDGLGTSTSTSFDTNTNTSSSMNTLLGEGCGGGAHRG